MRLKQLNKPKLIQLMMDKVYKNKISKDKFNVNQQIKIKILMVNAQIVEIKYVNVVELKEKNKKKELLQELKIIVIFLTDLILVILAIQKATEKYNKIKIDILENDLFKYFFNPYFSLLFLFLLHFYL